MIQIISKLKLQVIKEKGYEYNYGEKQKFDSPASIASFCTNMLEIAKEAEEIMYMFTLDTKNNLTSCFEVSRGSINSTIVHPREVYKKAVIQNATNIILVHNHPSGEPEASHEDILLTNRLVECGKIVGIKVIDHIIKKFCEEGLLIWSQHAAVRCQQRGIKTSDIENCLINGEIIEKYFDDYPYPSCLILGVTINKQYLHVVCGIGDNKLWIITSYFPSEENWESDRRTRKESK